MRASWLFSKHPLVIDDDLACVIGLNEAIVTQQLNYWLHSRHAKEIDGSLWVYNSYESWQKTNFRFFSVSTVRRTFEKLEKKGIVKTGNFNRYGFDKTKWYTIDEDKLNEIMRLAKSDDRFVQNEQTSSSNRADGDVQNEQVGLSKVSKPIPDTTRDYSDTTSDSKSSGKPETHIPYKEIIDYLNQITGKHYRSTTGATKDLIKARWNEGFRESDFKKVIDIKASHWLNDEKMSNYLQPSTLFARKHFETYLNQKPNANTNQAPSSGFDADLVASESADFKDLPF